MPLKSERSQELRDSGKSEISSARFIRSKLTIGIATKDRPEVVDATLQKIYRFGLGQCDLIIYDDGSSTAICPPSLALFRHGRLIRNARSQGQATARNSIARKCNTPFLLQLDDDSYPVAGDLKDLCRFAENASDWLAIALPFEEPARNRGFPVGIPDSHAIRIRSFVGCSVLINVERFLSLGGYASWIDGWGEEEELCLRALSAGLQILSIDMARIRHDVTATNRNLNRISFQSVRNWLLLWIAHAPASALPGRMLRHLASTGRVSMRQRSVAPLNGYLHGLALAGRAWRQRKAVTPEYYQKFLNLPHALDFFEVT